MKTAETKPTGANRGNGDCQIRPCFFVLSLFQIFADELNVGMDSICDYLRNPWMTFSLICFRVFRVFRGFSLSRGTSPDRCQVKFAP